MRGRPIHNPINNEPRYHPNKEFTMVQETTHAFKREYRPYWERIPIEEKRKTICGPGSYRPNHNYVMNKF